MKADDDIEGRTRDALDASTDPLPPGVASRLAAARAEALATTTRPALGAPLGWAALASVAALTLALLVVLPDRGAPSDGVVVDARAPTDGNAADLADVDVALELELLEDLEFVAWLAVEEPAEARTGAG